MRNGFLAQIEASDSRQITCSKIENNLSTLSKPVPKNMLMSDGRGDLARLILTYVEPPQGSHDGWRKEALQKKER